MYFFSTEGYVPVNSKTAHAPPPGQTPGHLTQVHRCRLRTAQWNRICRTQSRSQSSRVFWSAPRHVTWRWPKDTWALGRRLCRNRLFPLLFGTGCSQGSRFPTAGPGERSSGNEIGFEPSPSDWEGREVVTKANDLDRLRIGLWGRLPLLVEILGNKSTPLP